MATIHATNATFDNEVLSSTEPVLVDFWAPWCGPCKTLAPILEDLSVEVTGKAKIVKVNVDEESELAIRYNVSSIPSLFLFKNGQVANHAVGVQSKTVLLNMLEK